MTFEEISKYPVGTVIDLGDVVKNFSGFWVSEKDKQLIQNQEKWIELTFNVDSTWEGKCIRKETYTVQGWLYDGYEWEIAESSWDGWAPADFESILQKKKEVEDWKKKLLNF